MHILKTVIKKSFLLVSIVTLMGGSTLGVYAQTADGGSDTKESKTEEVKKDPQYSYDPVTGNWVSDKYSWNPNTGITTPLPKQGPTTAPGPTGTTGRPGDTNSSVGTTGPGSTNSTANNGTSNAQVNNNNGLNVNNQIGATATTGNSTVSGNTKAGSATTGDAQSIANIMNMLQSQTNLGGNGMVTFQQDINGDVVGDILLNPELIFNTGPGSTNSSTNNQSGNATINNVTNAAVTNDVDLAAASGNASVNSNTEAGDAKTGDAYVMANVVNVLNSVIQANQSFMGLINIYGNLDGDILFPPETINKLLTSNVPTTNISINNATGDITLNNTNNQAINNNINLNATSGAANTSGNTNAGNATTGSAKTNLTVLNLTGHEVIGANSILVFVNVLGTWMGMIMDAPNGATAAALGGGISQDNRTLNAEMNNTNNATINNNLNLNATTGDADVTNNTSGGNATTGNAYAAANVANVNNSSLNLSNWFGLLFINVFGSWNGSFGVDTLAGTRQASVGGYGSGSSESSEATPAVFGFTPTDNSTKNSSKKKLVVPLTSGSDNSQNGSGPSALLASANGGSSGTIQPSGTTEQLAQATKKNNQTVMMVTGAGVILGVTMMGAERVSTWKQGRRSRKEVFAGISGPQATEDL